MLGKLLKYEFKASARLFLLLYGALLLVTIINSVLLRIGDNLSEANWVYSLAQGIVMFSYIMLILAVAITTIVVIIMRFYKNLMGDEGYLMFTLPVSTDSHILSKVITSVVWFSTSILVVIGSIIMLTSHLGILGDIYDALKAASEEGLNIAGWIIAIVILIIVYQIHLILMFYASMSIGPNLTKNRLLGSFLGYIIMYIISQVVGLLSLAVLYVIGQWDALTEYGNEALPAEEMVNMMNSVSFKIILFVLVIEALLVGIYYIITRYFIKNKLNLS